MNKLNFLSIMVIISLALCVLFGIIGVIFQAATGQELSPTLVENWFKVFGTEIAATGIIYIVKRITSIWRVEDKIKLKKDNGFELKESDFGMSNEDVYDSPEVNELFGSIIGNSEIEYGGGD